MKRDVWGVWQKEAWGSMSGMETHAHTRFRDQRLHRQMSAECPGKHVCQVPGEAGFRV